jgi:hypothetical protein
VATPPTPGRADLPLPRVYGRRTLATFSRLIDTLCPPADVFPRPATERVLGTVLSFIPFLPLPLRYGLPSALWFFERAPLFFGLGRRRFGALTDEEAERYLRRWEHGSPAFAMTFQALRSLVLASYYSHPEIAEALGLDWQSRARELVERRGRLLKMNPEIANPRNAPGRKEARERA